MEETKSSTTAERAMVFKAMGHPSRMLILEALAREPRNVGELTELVGSDMSTVSKHLTVLKSAGIVADECRGRSVYYSICCPCIPKIMRCVDEFFEYKAGSQAYASAPLATLQANAL